MRSFTIVVTDNDTGASYDHTLHVDEKVPPDMLARDFLQAFYRAGLFHSERTGICPGAAADD